MASSSITERLKKALERNPWFARRPAEIKRRLIAHAQVSTVDAGHWLYAAGDEARGLYGALSGSAMVYVMLDNGENVPVNIAGPGTFFGYAAQLLGGHRVTTAVTHERSEIIFIPQRALNAIANEFPSLWLHLAEQTTEQLVGIMKIMGERSHLSPKAWLASRLHAFASVWEAHDGATTVPVRQDQFAELSGYSRKTINLLLREFEKKGLITIAYRSVIIRDADALSKIAIDASI